MFHMYKHLFNRASRVRIGLKLNRMDEDMLVARVYISNPHDFQFQHPGVISWMACLCIYTNTVLIPIVSILLSNPPFLWREPLRFLLHENPDWMRPKILKLNWIDLICLDDRPGWAFTLSTGGCSPASPFPAWPFSILDSSNHPSPSTLFDHIRFKEFIKFITVLSIKLFVFRTKPPGLTFSHSLD